MKFTVVATAALAATGASANMLKSYSQHRPQKHQVARSPMPQQQQQASSILALKSAKFAAAAAGDEQQQQQQSVVGGATIAASNIVSATGTFQVPQARQPTQGPTGNNPITYGAAFWIGIDGAKACPSASLRAGVDIFWDPEGTSYNAWYQLAPGRSVDFSGPLGAEPGDTVRITAKVNGTTSAASVTFENLSTGLQATQTFDAANGVGQLCRREASWLVEDFVLEQSTGLPVPLVDFNTTTFSDMAATAGLAGEAPSSVDINAAVIVDIHQDQQGGRLTDCSRTGAELVCKRIFGTA